MPDDKQLFVVCCCSDKDWFWTAFPPRLFQRSSDQYSQCTSRISVYHKIKAQRDTRWFPPEGKGLSTGRGFISQNPRARMSHDVDSSLETLCKPQSGRFLTCSDFCKQIIICARLPDPNNPSYAPVSLRQPSLNPTVFSLVSVWKPAEI